MIRIDINYEASNDEETYFMVWDDQTPIEKQSVQLVKINQPKPKFKEGDLVYYEIYPFQYEVREVILNRGHPHNFLYLQKKAGTLGKELTLAEINQMSKEMGYSWSYELGKGLSFMEISEEELVESHTRMKKQMKDLVVVHSQLKRYVNTTSIKVNPPLQGYIQAVKLEDKAKYKPNFVSPEVDYPDW